MRPDLRNILIVSEGERESARKFVARHRAFAELSAERQSPTEALLDLLALLKRSAGWGEDAWHCLELDRAIFDVETTLKLLVSPDRLSISGHDCEITKINDSIYVMNYASEVEQAGVEDPGRRASEGSREPGDAIVIYSVGRRCWDRHESEPGRGLRPHQPERRLSQRRGGDRRRFKRLDIVARIAGE
jgi:hypothetical protein